MTRLVTAPVREALDATGLEWSVVRGTRHYHLRLGGRLIGILPRSPQTSMGRAERNLIAQIKRAARQGVQP